MANTKTSAKRARQALKRQERNQSIRSATRSAFRTAVDAMKKQDATLGKQAYQQAIKALSKAASKGAIPQGRAARKISRLTLFAKKSVPAIFN